MDHDELHQFARDRLRSLGLRPPLDQEKLRLAIGRERGTTVHLIPSADIPPGSAYGVTGGDAHNDVVLFEARTTHSHQLLIILHEFAHMLLRHPRAAVDHSPDPESFQMISAAAVAETLGVPNPAEEEGDAARRPRRWSRLRRRRPPNPHTGPTLYKSRIEWEAETLATILLGWTPGQAEHVHTPPDEALGQILGDEGAW